MTWVLANIEQIWSLTLDHILLSVPPILVGFLLAVPIGWLAHRYRVSRGVLLTVCGLLYTIPSLALIVAMPTLLGTKILNPANLIVTLTIYAIALMVRTATDAFDAVSKDVTQSATAVGFGGWRRFWQVELPLAGPVLLAGLRVVSTSTVSLVTLGALVGMSGLGYLFTNGYQRNFATEILTGIVGTVLIAIVFDVVLVILGRMLLPWARVDTAARRNAKTATTKAVTA
ncbi:ABC transporter permease [Mycetocola manganoxydans]|uniref:ABC transporter permease n=1 Tax=Mycetocola manganoxydans TaxID=699879 RepID=A0A3L6ZYZ5_9MICO|nr:ABC transporter permease [Mycetocola manganoxydans]RLP72925.1 ABC transporter permease [Mycetocola manganoxydans]GHD44964.1 glycine/betaine ABC transporter permease [Mycetocola manganoxydans]